MASFIDRMTSLIDRGRAGAWDPETAIDWAAAPHRPRWLPQRAWVQAISQFYHGEGAALTVCRRLSQRVALPMETAFLQTQIADEERHQQVYVRYLARIGDLAERDTGFSQAIDGALAWDGEPEGLVVACHLLLEVDAIKLQGAIARTFNCPLLRAINLRVAQDEARHVAFGRIWLQQRIPALPDESRARIFAWAKSLWFATIDLDDESGAASLNGLLGRVRRRYIEKRWEVQCRNLLDLGLIESDGSSSRQFGGAVCASRS